MLPLLSYQKLTNHIDGTTAPSATITSGDQSIPNPAFTTWNDFDQRAVILLNSSLTEEAAAEVLGLTTAHAIWTALETAYSNSSVERIHSLRDSLRNLSKGTSTVSDYGRQFKGICDKLAAIGQPVDEMDKLHWFVCGLGASFETFSTAIRTTKPFTTFRDLLSQAESHEMFLKSLHGSATPPAAFFSQQSGSRSSQGRQQRQQNYSRGGGRASNSNGGRGRGGRRPPHCQLCRTNGHYASSCPSLHTYASNAATSDANLAQAFTSQCHVTQGHPDWYVDSGATAHMTSSPDNVSHSAALIRDRETKQVIAQGLCEDGLYVLRDTPMALAATVGVSRKASFELWHNRQWHTSPIIMSLHTSTNGRAERKHRHLVETGLAMLFHAHVPASYWVDAFSSATSYNCLFRFSSRIYITRHARFDEVTFPFASTANPNALSTLQLCTFLEDGPPISDAPVPESRPTDTRPSSSSPCGLCPVPTTAAEPIHEPDSTPSSPFNRRVVAQGFTQIPGLDYSHTFCPVVKASTVRIVLSLVVLHRWRLHQLDVRNNAILHGHLNEMFTWEQPQGFK
ncbi:putative RNA-directed DNA polymerase [Tanacetum coccineum]